MVCTTLGTTKPSRGSTETNAHAVYAFLVQLQANGTKIFTSFVLFWFQNCAQVKLWVVSIHWTGLLDWNTGLEYWTGLLD